MEKAEFEKMRSQLRVQLLSEAEAHLKTIKLEKLEDVLEVIGDMNGVLDILHMINGAKDDITLASVAKRYLSDEE